MAVKKIKIGSSTAIDIHDARNVVVGNGVNNAVALTTSQYEALTTKDANTLYVITDASPGSGGSTVTWGTESNNTVPLTVDNTSKTVALAAALTHKANTAAVGQVSSDNVVETEGLYEPSAGFVFALPGSDLESSGEHDYTLMTTVNAVKLTDEFVGAYGGGGVRGLYGIDDGMSYAVGSDNADGSEDYILATTADINTALGNIETLLAAL